MKSILMSTGGNGVKIYIETDMTELPKNCNECPFYVTTKYKSIRSKHYEDCTYCPLGTGCYKFEGHINAMGDYDEIDTCPLRTETEIADKKEEDNNAKQF